MAHVSLSSPVGSLSLFEDGGKIVALEWGKVSARESSKLLEDAARQLNAYFDGRLKTFDLPLAPQGTSFQRAVWDQLCLIPYAEARTYGDVAKAVRSAPRPVGGACGRNPIPIIIPCHRVLASGGRIGGFSGYAGVETKRRLLKLEGYPIT